MKPSSFFVVCLVATLISGYLIGRIHSAFIAVPTSPLMITQDTRQKIPVVMIDDVHDGNIEGTASGHVRVFGEGKMVVPNAQGAFKIPVKSLKRTVEILVPAGAKYAASRNGKKYYDVQSPAAARLKPQTRIYFQSEAEAIAAGYTK